MKRFLSENFIIIIKLLIIFIISFLGWAIFSMNYSIANIVSGIVFSLMISFFCYEYFYRSDNIILYSFLFRIDLLVLYVTWILVEGYISAFQLIVMMLSGKYSPGIVRIKTRLRSKFAQAFLSNTISLIPGTISLWMEDNTIFVHWFDVRSNHSLEAGEMIKGRIERILLRIFG